MATDVAVEEKHGEGYCNRETREKIKHKSSGSHGHVGFGGGLFRFSNHKPTRTSHVTYFAVSNAQNGGPCKNIKLKICKLAVMQRRTERELSVYI